MNSFERNFVIVFTAYMSPLTIPLVVWGVWFIFETEAGLIGIAYCVLVTLINKLLSKISVKYRKLKTGNTDNRINLTEEIVEEIRFAKMQGFDQEVKKDIVNFRKKEVHFSEII